MRGSEFVFHSINFMLYNLHKTRLNRAGSYIDFPKWLKKQEAVQKIIITMANVFNTLQQLIRKKQVFHHEKRIRRSFK